MVRKCIQQMVGTSASAFEASSVPSSSSCGVNVRSAQSPEREREPEADSSNPSLSLLRLSPSQKPMSTSCVTMPFAKSASDSPVRLLPPLPPPPPPPPPPTPPAYQLCLQVNGKSRSPSGAAASSDKGASSKRQDQDDKKHGKGSSSVHPSTHTIFSQSMRPYVM